MKVKEREGSSGGGEELSSKSEVKAKSKKWRRRKVKRKSEKWKVNNEKGGGVEKWKWWIDKWKSRSERVNSKNE